MNSRMEKYYKDEDLPKRSVKNKNLYETMYEDNDYQEVNISPREKTINIEELRKMIHNTPKRVERKQVETISSYDEDESYDLNDAIERARSNKVIDDKKRSISNTQYDILKNIKIRDVNTTSLDDVLDTSSNKNLITEDVDLFDNLKSLDDTTVGEPTNYDMNGERTRTMDDSFFTKSMKLDPSDFESINSGLEQNNKMMKIIFILILVLIAIVLGIIIILVV